MKNNSKAESACRMSSMEYPPPVPLPVPPNMPPVSDDIGSLGLKGLGLMTPEEEESNQQLYYAVRCTARYRLTWTCDGVKTTASLHRGCY